jgi:hypothetical protein
MTTQRLDDASMTTQTERRPAMRSPRALLGIAALLALTVVPAPAAAQPALNIAGIYRGLMTGCLTSTRSADCRKGYFELIRLADEVDARRVEWERAAAGASAAKLQEGYAQAKERLNRAVDDFNRDMSAPAASAPAASVPAAQAKQDAK